MLKIYSVFTEGCDDAVGLWLTHCNSEKKLKAWEAVFIQNRFFRFIFQEISATEGPCKGLFLKDFLIKPVQRICKYPLLLRVRPKLIFKLIDSGTSKLYSS